MTKADNDRMGTKEFVQQRWQAHRDVFRVGAFVPAQGELGFVVVDRVQQPPVCYVAKASADGAVRVLMADLPSDLHGRGELGALAARVLSNEFPSNNLSVDEGLRLLGLAADNAGGLAELSVRRFCESLGDPRIAARVPRAGLETSEGRRFDAAGLATIRALLNPDALAALSSVDSFLWKHYSFYAETGDKGDIRRAAAGHYPLFATFITNRFSVARGIDAQVAERTKAIDYLASDEHRAKLAAPVERNGETRTLEEWMRMDGRDPNAPWQLSEKVVRQTLQAAFAKDENDQPTVPNHVLANLRGVTWPTNGIPIDRIVSALAQLPADWAPKTRPDWDAFCDLTATVGRLMPDMTGTPLRMLYEGCSGKWDALRDRIMHAYADSRPPEGSTEADVAYLEGGIDWDALKALPRDKVRAAAVEAVSRLENFPEGIARNDVENWIVGRIAPDVGREAIHNACIEIQEMAETFGRKVVLPIAANAATRRSGMDEHPLAEQHNVAAAQAAARILLPGKSVVRLMETVRAYVNRADEISAAGLSLETDAQLAAREEQRRIQAAEREAALAAAAATQAANAVGIDPTAPIPKNGWPPLSNVIQAPNGVYIVPLTDPDMLADEGRGWGNAEDGGRNADGSMGLGICVGGNSYVNRCQRNGEHIVSFRIAGSNGEPYTRLSCMQVGPLTMGSGILKNLQHRGQGNRTVPEAANKAWEWYKAAAARGEIPLNHDKVRERLEIVRKVKVDEVALACGYDWKDPRRLLRAMTPWGPFVGKKHRKMGVDDLAADADVQDVVQALDPQMDYGRAPGR